MDRPKVWWRVALGLALAALLGMAVPAAKLAQAASVDDNSNQLGQVNALFLAGFYRGNGDVVELTVINPNARKDGSNVDALVLVYDREALPIGCGLFTLKPNEITDPIDLEQLIEDSGGDGLDDFGSVLVVVTQTDDDFIGTANSGKKKKKSKNNGAAAERGALAYITQSDGSNSLSQVRLWPFDLDGTEASQIRSDFVDSTFCDGSSAAKLNRSDPARVQSNVDSANKHSSGSKRSTRTRKSSTLLTTGGNDSE